MTNEQQDAMLAALHEARDFHRAHGHQTAGILIGHYEEQTRIADERGAYDFHIGPHGWTCTSIGETSSTLQGIAHCAVTTANKETPNR